MEVLNKGLIFQNIYYRKNSIFIFVADFSEINKRGASDKAWRFDFFLKKEKDLLHTYINTKENWKCFTLITFPSTDPLKETEILTKKNPTDYLPLCTGVLLTTKTALTSGSCIEQAQKDRDRSQDIGVWDRISSLQVTNI